MLNLKPYRTSGSEYATYKNIPIQFLEKVQYELKVAQNQGMLGQCYRIRYRFRGPRIGTGKRHTLKKDAHSFAVYIDYLKRWGY